MKEPITFPFPSNFSQNKSFCDHQNVMYIIAYCAVYKVKDKDIVAKIVQKNTLIPILVASQKFKTGEFLEMNR